MDLFVGRRSSMQWRYPVNTFIVDLKNKPSELVGGQRPALCGRA